MSRSERRAYKRLMKNQDPYALPAAQRTRMDRQRTRRARSRPPVGEFRFVTSRFLVWLLGGALVIGLVAFSIAWPNGMPMAGYVGVAAALGWGALAAVVRLAQRRMAGRPT